MLTVKNGNLPLDRDMPLSPSLKVNPGWSVNHLSKELPLRKVYPPMSCYGDRRNNYPFDDIMDFSLPRISALCAVATELSGGSVGSSHFSET